jgi:hypothetical protein
VCATKTASSLGSFNCFQRFVSGTVDVPVLAPVPGLGEPISKRCPELVMQCIKAGLIERPHSHRARVSDQRMNGIGRRECFCSRGKIAKSAKNTGQCLEVVREPLPVMDPGESNPPTPSRRWPRPRCAPATCARRQAAPVPCRRITSSRAPVPAPPLSCYEAQPAQDRRRTGSNSVPMSMANSGRCATRAGKATVSSVWW